MQLNRENIIPLHGMVLIKPLIEGLENKVKIGGQELFITGDFQAHKVANVTGEVIASPENPNTPVSDWIVSKSEIEPGDLVWYAFNSIREAYDRTGAGNAVQVDGVGLCIWIPYERCFARVKKSDIEIFHQTKGIEKFQYVMGMNGYLLGVPYTRDEKLFAITETRKIKQICKIITYSAPTDRYTAIGRDGDEEYARDKNVPVEVGQYVILDADCDIPIEGEYARMLSIEGHAPFRFQRRNIKAIIDNPDLLDISYYKSTADGFNTDETVDKDYWDKHVAERQNAGKKTFHF